MNAATILNDVFWYAVSTRSRQEKTAASTLESLSIPNFLPLTTEKRQWSDRQQKVSVPLFPGYVFVRISMLHEMRLRVLKVPGIVTFIGNRSGPQQIPDAEIDGVRTVLSHRIECTPCPIPRVGDRVRVFRGLLRGIEGTLVRSGSDSNLVISVETIQRSLSIHVDGSDVEPVSNPSPSPFFTATPLLFAEQGC